MSETSERREDPATSSWLRACGVDDVPPGEAIVLPVCPPVALFNVDGEFHATADTCTHAESSLADGFIEGDVVECAFHYATFRITDGKALTAPATVALRTYETKLEGGEVFVDVTGTVPQASS